MKKIISILIFLIGYAQYTWAQQIPVNFYGINYWSPGQIPITSTSGYPNGKVDNANIQNMVMRAGVSIYRIGGNGYDEFGNAIGVDAATNDYIAAIEKVRIVNPNARFLIQVPFKWGVSTADAVTLVTNIKNRYPGVQFYYSIGNEWDLYKQSVFPYSKLYTCAQIANFIKSYAIAMKNEDPTIKIVAPSLSSFWAEDNTTTRILPNLINGGGANDITGVISGGPANGKFFVDVIDYHTYAGGNNGDMSYNKSGATLTSTDFTNYGNACIAYPGNGFNNELSASTSPFTGLRKLIGDANAFHVRTGANALTFAITEMNICYLNPYLLAGSTSTSPYENTTQGIGSRSFFAGQYWADMFSSILRNGTGTTAGAVQTEFVMPWSIHESGGGGFTDLGMTKGLASPILDPTPLSTYYHFKLMSQYFRGPYKTGEVTGSAGVTITSNVKAFASQYCSQIRVMVMNQNNDATTRDVLIRFDNGTPSVSKEVIVKIPGGGINKEYITTIGYEETIVFIFDGCGNILKKIVYNTTSGPTPYYLAPSLTKYCSKCLPINKCVTFDNTTTPNITSYESSILSDSVTISDSASFQGTIRVPNGVVLTIDKAEVLFSPGAKIEVMPGGKIAIKNSFLHGCDGQPWDGIYVNGNNTSSVQITIENSKITDALTAVSANKTNNISIIGSVFSDGIVAIDLNKVKNFTILKNEITNFEYGIKTSKTLVNTALIKQNYFLDVKYAIFMEDDNHSKLDISCNTFDNYTDYAVRSTGSILKDQGSLSEGAGNVFTSSSVLMNNKFSHDGNPITYYVDPSLPITLTTGVGMNVSTSLADGDGCIPISRQQEDASSQNEENSLTAEVLKGSTINVYPVPNPNAGAASIYYNLGQDNQGEITIMDIYGKTIQRLKVNPDAVKVDVDLKEYANGIYIISLSNSKGEVIIKKMIIAK